MSEATKFTPGPWKWSAGWAMGASDLEGRSCVQSELGELIFYSCDGCSLEPSDADAALVAAAPELYAELAKISATICSFESEGIRPDEWLMREWVRDAETALRKARGEA